MAASAVEQQGLLRPAEETDAEGGSCSDGTGGVGPRCRVPARAWALALGLAVAGMAAAWLQPAPPAAGGWREGPLLTGSLAADGAAVQSKAEGQPTESEGPTAVAIKWTKDLTKCVEVNMRGATPEGQSLNVRPCGIRSKQFILEDSLQGQIKWTGVPGYCVTAPGFSDLELKKCADASAEISEFSIADDGHITVKARPQDCVMVDTHSADKAGRYDVIVQDCHAFDGGDSPHPPEPEDYFFTIEGTTTTTVATTPAATTPAATTKPTTTTAAGLHLLSRVIFRSTHGLYMAAELDGRIFCNRPWADDWEKFEVEHLADGRFALKSFHGSYLRANANGEVMATSKKPGHNGHFEIVQTPTGAVAIKSAYGKYLSAKPHGTMMADSTTRGGGEEFMVVDLANDWPDHVAIKSFHGKYFRAYPNNGVLKADGTWPLDPWERFRVIHNEGGTITLKVDHGEYMSIDSAGAMHASSKNAGGAEAWEIAHLDCGNFTMKSHLGKYIFVYKNGHVAADHANPGADWEKLQVVMLP